jgi:hypothetical protein
MFSFPENGFQSNHQNKFEKRKKKKEKKEEYIFLGAEIKD